MIDDRTPHLNLPLPSIANNPRTEDVERLRQALIGLDASAWTFPQALNEERKGQARENIDAASPVDVGNAIAVALEQGNVVRTDAQILSEEQKAQAFENLGGSEIFRRSNAPSLAFDNPYLLGNCLNQAILSFDAESGDTPELGVHTYLTSTVGEENHDTAFKVAMGGYATAGPGSAAVFASNFTSQAAAGFSSHLFSCELDINWDAGVDAGDIASLTESGALKINGAGSGRSTYGISVAGVYSTQFRNGIVFTGAAGFISEVGIRFDNSGMSSILRANSSSFAGINLGSASILNGPGNAFIAPPGDGFGALKSDGTAVLPLIHASGDDEVLVGSGTQPVRVNAPSISPLVDNATALGASDRRFTAVYAANGTIQTSNPDLKTDVAPLPPVGSLIDAIDPITFRWIEGGTEAVDEEIEQEVIATEPVTVRKTYVAEGIAFEVEEIDQRPVVEFLPVVDSWGNAVMETVPARPEVRHPKTGVILRAAEPAFERQKMIAAPVYTTKTTTRTVQHRCPGKRTHWGFDARNVKQAFDDLGSDFGGYVKDGDFEGIRPDQLIPILWQAVKDLRRQVQDLASEA